MSRTTTARWASLALATSIGTALLTGGTAADAVTVGAATPATSSVSEQISARNPCGLYRDGEQAMYKNCTDANENIFVTRILAGNTYYCVTPGSVKHLGPWNRVFRVYNRGGC
ncbi:DUF6355 family natural product biosynthesis protein [Nonomuraea roseola]|uniref:DUF6355 family natural product biosynthesis protein n=1 Tax=Nonomuraea roseola TaxID=46179 RepID=A0ABV5QDB2_9ACTN